MDMYFIISAVSASDDKNLEKMVSSIKSLPLEKFIKALLILVIGFTAIRIGYKYISTAISLSKIDPVLHGVIKQTVKITMQVIVILTALEALDITFTGLAAILGTLSLALSLAAKDSVADVASGLIILLNKEFTVGDYVEIGVNIGVIQKLTLTYIRINTKDNRQVFIPNAMVAKSVVVNHSREDKRRLDVEIEIPASDDIDDTKNIIMSVVSRSDLVLKGEDVEVVVSDFNTLVTILLLKVWTKTDDIQNLKYFLKENIKKELQNKSEKTK